MSSFSSRHEKKNLLPNNDANDDDANSVSSRSILVGDINEIFDNLLPSSSTHSSSTGTTPRSNDNNNDKGEEQENMGNNFELHLPNLDELMREKLTLTNISNDNNHSQQLQQQQASTWNDHYIHHDMTDLSIGTSQFYHSTTSQGFDGSVGLEGFDHGSEFVSHVLVQQWHTFLKNL